MIPPQWGMLTIGARPIYEEIETAFLDWCRELSAPPAAFDLFIWELQRGDLSRMSGLEDMAA